MTIFLFRNGDNPIEYCATDTRSGHRLPTAFFAFGSGTGWAAALEASLLVKELAQVPGEGVELREAATTVMTTLKPGHLVVDLTPGAPGADETEAACSGRGSRVVRTRRHPRQYALRLRR